MSTVMYNTVINNLLLGSDWKLVVIRQQCFIGKLPGGTTAYKIEKVAFLPLNLDDPKDFEIDVIF